MKEKTVISVTAKTVLTQQRTETKRDQKSTQQVPVKPVEEHLRRQLQSTSVCKEWIAANCVYLHRSGHTNSAFLELIVIRRFRTRNLDYRHKLFFKNRCFI